MKAIKDIKVYSVCHKCGDRYCCRGTCRELNDYLVEKEKNRKMERIRRKRIWVD